MKNLLGIVVPVAALLGAAFPVQVRAGEIVGSIQIPRNVARSNSPAVIYVVGRPAGESGGGPSTLVDQRDRAFEPRVQAMALGGSIVFRNSDPESHNVNSQSGCCTFNFMVPPVGATGPTDSEPFTPQKAGLVKLLCNIHPQMRGFVMVCPSAMFAVSEADGSFRITDVPDGSHRVVIWQESCKQVTRELEVQGSTRLDLELEGAAAESAPNGFVTRAAVPWSQVLRDIAAKLSMAVQIAENSRSAAEADRWALDAYFECFEASELETAVLLYRGEERKFVLERMFARIRRPMLGDLAAGKTDAETVRAAVTELCSEIDQDIRELNRAGVLDRSSINSNDSIAARVAANSRSAPAVETVLVQLRNAFSEVESLANAGNSAAAAAALADAYFQVFHQIEPMLVASNFAEMRQIESRFLELRGSIQAGLPADAVRTDLASLWADVDHASRPLVRGNSAGLASVLNRFWNAFLILTREGVEALLIVTALLLYLDRSRRPEGKRLIYGGIIVGLVATAFTWAVLQWVIAQSGIAQETIEGISALAAGAVLFYVSYWLLSKSEAARWQQFLSRQVDRHLSTGSKWALGVAAFLAIYREGAETILMFQPMWVHPTAREFGGMIAGIAAATLALAAIFWGLRYASFRMAIRPFFRVTGTLLFALAVVFAGRGVAELQEARVLAISPLPASLYNAIMAIPSVIRDACGITPNAQALAIQGIILTGAVLSLVSLWLAPSPSDPTKSIQLSVPKSDEPRRSRLSPAADSERTYATQQS